ncbi:MAG: DNA helicase RecQ [Bacteroidia bacterium]
MQRYFGYESFRPMQAEIIDTLLRGEDCLVLMPTGGGKSVCFQIPALLQPGTAVVISPLIALMKDQVEGLRANGIAASYLNSTQSAAEQAAIIDSLLLAELKLLYISPEKLLTAETFELLSRIKISLFAIDEAHCISSWGHDFRPEYTRLSVLRERFAQVPVVALTATADKTTRSDIARQLGLGAHRHFVSSFDRPNLSLTVLPGQGRMKTLLDFIRLRPGQSGIVYCLSRKTTEEVAARLRAEGIAAAHYHAGMPDAERAKAQEDFIRDEVPIVCATIAFGMGIDKSNVRWVVHYNLPRNLESYYQEIGRAGRDGLPSDTLLFYTYRDVIRMQEFIAESGQRELQLAKLDLMMEYATARICRRRILLNYFGEQPEHDCGNCDVCKQPPRRFDGTVIAQKALSAIVRLREQVGMTMLIDVLRGAQRKEIREKGYDQIKTFGAGSDMSVMEWQNSLIQMLQLGLVEIAYDAGHTLRVSDAGREVLFGRARIELVRPDFGKDDKPAARSERPLSAREQFDKQLFDALRLCRRQLAQQANVPPYVVFSDATLNGMVDRRPLTLVEMREIGGIGDEKLRRYGQVFLDEILRFLAARATEDTSLPTGVTRQVTYALHREGLDLEGIATRRGIKAETIARHAVDLLDAGYHLDPALLVPPPLFARIREALRSVDTSEGLRPLFEHFGEEIPYPYLRLATLLLRKA